MVFTYLKSVSQFLLPLYYQSKSDISLQPAPLGSHLIPWWNVYASDLRCALCILAATSAGCPVLYSTCKAMKESCGQVTGRWIISTADVPVLQELHSCGTTPDKDLCTEGNLAGGSLAWNPRRCGQTFSAGSYFTAQSMTSHLTERWRLWPHFSFNVSSAPHTHLRTLRMCQPVDPSPFPPHTLNPSLPLRHATLRFMLQRKKFLHPSPPSSESCQLRYSSLDLLGELMSPAITETPRTMWFLFHVVSC